jgi:nicotinamidase-related amidase
MENQNMTINMLDKRPALLVVDLQKGIVGLPTAHPIAGIVNNAAGLAAAFSQL